jgi:glycosyltransferase involved in cell wall biosynthesis
LNVKVSIVIPCFNQGEFLREAIESVLAQDHASVELIIVDGGSTDKTTKVIEAHADGIAWWVSESDRGQSHAVNKGLERCTGELVAFIGADDVYLPGAFANAARLFAESPESGAIVGGFVRIDERSRVISAPVPAAYPWEGPTDLMIAPPETWRLHQVSTFYARRALERVGPHVDEGLRYTMDRELLNRVCRRFPVMTSPRVYAAFRHHASSKSTREILPFSRELAALHLRDVPPNEPGRFARARRGLARRQRGGGYLKLACATAPGWRSLRALAVVPLVSPRLVLTRVYVIRWLEALGIAGPVRSLLGRPAGGRIVPRPLAEVAHEL